MSPKPWYANGLRFECTGCGNCCKNHGDYTFVYLAERDIEAIRGFLGLEREAFLEEYCEVVDGWVTLQMGEEACRFLDEKNRCTIYPVRPKQCATWPFWQENLDKAVWDGPVKECCPGIDDGPVTPAAEVERIAAETEAWYEEDDE